MMSPDQLRALADALEPMSAAPRFDCLPVVEFCAWLRQCAEQRPDGWQLVPVEPTEAMKSAGGHVNSEWLNDDAPLCESRYAMPMDGVWSAMLAAAPAAPQAEPKREPLSDDDINKLAWKQNLWTDHMIEFSFLAFAREVERAHGIGDSDDTK
jgi:hypothetical protein